MADSIGQVRLLIITLIFPPDAVSTAQLLGEIAEDLSEETRVSVITTSPHYNVDHEALSRQPITWRWHRLTGVSSFRGIEVTHIRMPQKATGRLARALQWAWFHVCSVLLAISRSSRFDVVLTASPPMTVAVVAALLKRVTKKPFVYVLWELYPEILVRLGKLKDGGLLHRVLCRVERFTYRQSNAVAVLHDPMRQAVLSSEPQARVEVIPTFADTDFLKPLPPSNQLKERFALVDKFVVGYAGNLGVSQDLRPVLEAAAILGDDSDTVFFIAGDGNDRVSLENKAHELGLANVIFAGQLPYSMVPELTAAFDICLVVLAEGISAEALPSKVYRIMACGRPILAVADPGTPLADLVTASGTGLVVSPEDPSRLAAVIDDLRNGLYDLDRFSSQARCLAVESYSRRAVTKRYLALVASVAGEDSA